MHTVDTNFMIRAPSQYTGVPFTSYATVGGRQIGVSPNGLFELCCGDSDNGVDIESHLAVVKTDFGIKGRKQLRYVYVHFKSDSDMFLEISVDDQIAERYIVKAPRAGQQYSRVTIRRGQRGAYFYFRLRNYVGNDFAIDMLSADVLTLSEGYK